MDSIKISFYPGHAGGNVGHQTAVIGNPTPLAQNPATGSAEQNDLFAQDP
jgi:hypothetical protein